MLILKNKELTSESFTIDSSDYSISLKSDIDCTFFGIITLNNEAEKIIQFSKIGSIYKARLIISKDILPYLKNSTFKLSCISSSFNLYTNKIPLIFDLSKIDLNIKIRASKDLEELSKQVAMLTQRFNTITKTGIIPGINIINKDIMKPGMIPVLIDDKGNFNVEYPFVNIISEVNGQRAVDGVVNIEASMIKYNKERTIVDQFVSLAKALKTTNEAIELLSNEIKVISKNLKNLQIKLDTHLDNGI